MSNRESDNAKDSTRTDQSAGGIDHVERRNLPRSIHKLFGTRRAEHADEYGHWPVFRGEEELLDTNFRGFTRCMRCALDTGSEK